eukprot:15344-Heterococcus_DN1.PRE.1
MAAGASEGVQQAPEVVESQESDAAPEVAAAYDDLRDPRSRKVKLHLRLIDGTKHQARSLSEKLYKKGVVREKTPEEAALIRRSVEANDLLTCLDEQQIENFAQFCVLLEYEPGEIVVRQGEYGDNLYICAEGVAEVRDADRGAEEVNLGDKHVGDSFGQGAIVLGRRRSASVFAKTHLKCWAVDLRTFEDRVLFSDKVKKLFETYASAEDAAGERLMTMDDFVKSCNDGINNDPVQGERLLTLLRLLRGDSEFINFRDFTVFNLLMTRPDPEFDIAFMLMDRDHKGYITRDDVSAFLLHNRRSQAVQFDMNCDVVKRYFGRNGDRRLRVDAFSVFFLSLQSEVAQQAFKRFDPDDTGFINREDLVSLLTNFRGWRINEGVADRIRGENPNRRFSFAEFVAYQNVMVHMPSLVTSINIACDVKKEAISKDDMKVMARTLLGNKLSRMEADAVFDVFDINKCVDSSSTRVASVFTVLVDGFIDGTDVKQVLGASAVAPLTAIKGRQGRITFAPPPGSDELFETSSSETAAAKKRRSKGHSSDNAVIEWITDFCAHFLLGAIAGGIGASAVYPIDLCKTRMQNQRSAPAATADGVAKLLYKNSLDCFRQTFRNEGFKGLYRGLLPQLVGVAPEKAIKLTVNDLLRDAFTNKDKLSGQDKIFFPLEVLAGCGAGASQVVFTNPLEITKIRLQMQGETYTLAKAAGKVPLPKQQSAIEIVRGLGVVGLYRGAAACFLRDIPFSGLYFPAYAAAKRWLSSGETSSKPQAHHLLIAGAMAGIPAASLTTPADVIKCCWD